MPKKANKKPHFYSTTWFRWLVGVGVFVLMILGAFRVSPWPGVLVIRRVFDRGSHATLVGLQRDIPAQPVTVLKDQYYGKGSSQKLDVYVPNAVVHSSKTLPVVIWTHGGAWLSGDKQDAAPYYRLLTAQGFVVIALDYSLAPGAVYPTQLRQLNGAYAYIQANILRFHADTGKIVFAGDSAGSQLSSQMAAIITNPAYAKEVGIQPMLRANQLAGVALFCGIYKLEGLTTPDPTLPKVVSWGSDVSVWAYLGTRNKQSPLVRQASTYYHVTAAFPASFISGGNGDPLTNAQSVPLAQRLTSLGVPVTTLFYQSNHIPSLPHEYQFTLNTDGKNAFAQLVQFLNQHTR